jgi:RHS repeat-associated protein
MKTRLKLNWLVVMGIALTGLLPSARAFYAPAAQRWLNRDPLGEPGFEMVQGELANVVGDGPNLYCFVGNSPLNEFDALGLERDCDAEHNQCWSDCWNGTPPWPAEKGKQGHYAYCGTKCLAEYMECLGDNAYKKFKPLCEKAIKDKKRIYFVPFPLPRPFVIPRPVPFPSPLPAPVPA